MLLLAFHNSLIFFKVLILSVSLLLSFLPVRFFAWVRETLSIIEWIHHPIENAFKILNSWGFLSSTSPPPIFLVKKISFINICLAPSLIKLTAILGDCNASPFSFIIYLFILLSTTDSLISWRRCQEG